jgi:sugar diacid utilization regulator
MQTLGELLAAPRIAELIVPITEGERDRRVEGVTCAETLSQLDGVGANSMVVLTEAASGQVATYRFDIALRVAGSRGVPALVLMGGVTALPETAVAIANRAGIALLRAVDGADLASIVVGVSRELLGGARAALARAGAALKALREAEARDAEEDELTAVAARALGIPLSRREGEALRAPASRDSEQRAEVVGVHDEPVVIAAPRGATSDETATDLVLQLTADAVARCLFRMRYAAEIPVRSSAQLLTEILVASPERLAALLHRARTMGMPIDGWHVVVSIEVDELPSAARGDEVASFEFSERVARVAIEAARGQGGVWYRATSGPALLLIRMERGDPGPAAPAAAATAAELVVKRLLARVAQLSVFCGVGSAHQGVAGLRASAAEAGAAIAAAKTAGRRNTALSFDAVGLRRMLVEWYASDTARRAVESILSPLDSLGPKRGETAIKTLQAYLDNQGSLTKTAQALHLHRNAVAYRLKRILDVLDVDLEDPDERLILQLACRTRALV